MTKTLEGLLAFPGRLLRQQRERIAQGPREQYKKKEGHTQMTVSQGDPLKSFDRDSFLSASHYRNRFTRNSVSSAVGSKFSSFTKRMACPIKLKLSNGAEMPVLGYGTWQANDDELEAALNCALEAGYRHIDTAYVYKNEHVIGKVIKKWMNENKLKREDLFIVTKLPNIGNRPAHVEKFLDLSLSKLQLNYVDMYLIHTPFGLNYKDDETTIPFKPDKTADFDFTTDLKAIWKKMEEMVDKGKTKAIGVSNFNIKQVKKILQVARIRPATNQVELHVYHQQRELESYLKSENITLTAYSSLGTGGSVTFLGDLGIKRELPNLLVNPIVKEIANDVKKTTAQVLLRFIIQRGIATIPKSTKPERIRENIDIFNFELSPKQMQRLFDIDQKTRILRMEEIFVGLEKHPEYPFRDN